MIIIFKKSILLSFFLILSLTVLSQEAPNKLSIYWDASFSMIEKNLDLEINVLEEYIRINSVDDIEITVFANTVLEKKIFSDVNSNTREFLDFLKMVNYDGSTKHPEILLRSGQSRKILYFSDQLPKMGDFSDKLIIVNSTPNNLEDVKVKYLPLYNIDQEHLSEIVVNDFSKKIVDKYLKKQQTESTLKKEITVSGYIFNEDGAIEGAQISSIYDQQNSTRSNKDGRYTFQSYTKDIVSVKTVRGKEQLIKIEDKGDVEIQLDFGDKMNQLKEVVITDKQEKARLSENEYWEEDRSKGYSIVRVTSDQYKTGHTDVGQLISGKVPGVKYQGKQDLGSAIIRGFSSYINTNHPVVYIDGIITEQSQVSNKTDYSYIDPSTIKDVKVLKGLAATAIYGPNAVNGVVLITTKSGLINKEEKKSGRRGTTKRMKEDLKVIDLDNFNAIRVKLIASQEAYSVYLKERLIAGGDVDFYFDAFDAFKAKGQLEIAKRVLSNIKEVYEFDKDALIALAYKFEKEKYYLDAHNLISKLSKEYPSSLQLKRDLAKSYIRLNDFESAGVLYEEILTTFPLSEDFKMAITTEIRGTYNKYPSGVLPWSLSTFKPSKIALDGLVTLEWNVPNEDFSFQFVNPTKNYHQWKHDSFRSQNEMNNELKHDTRFQEFQLINAEKGEWFFNILMDEKKERSPNSFLKMTITKDLGRPTENTEVKFFSLNENSSRVTLGSIII
ncbi:TonB-dependent receptor plug domain-containing protein [Dokdonia sp. R86516]|uniref:TonB-dependent receptor plug domain-containing protein n=1 Tax=Dokdonia sp. R86516 TaxID=3093856 RepID=UPI0037CB5189